MKGRNINQEQKSGAKSAIFKKRAIPKKFKGAVWATKTSYVIFYSFGF